MCRPPASLLTTCDPCITTERRLLDKLAQQLQQAAAAAADKPAALELRQRRAAAACWLVSAAADQARLARVDDHHCLLQLFEAAAPLLAACLASSAAACSAGGTSMPPDLLPGVHALSSIVALLAAVDEPCGTLAGEACKTALAPAALPPWLLAELPALQRLACSTTSGAGARSRAGARMSACICELA